MQTNDIVFFGYGKTTKAIAKMLGGGFRFYDDNTIESREDENKNIILPPSSFDPSQSKLEITTPSLKPDNPLVKNACNLISEYDFFLSKKYAHLNHMHAKPFTIWISGTNGKTTTTQMLTQLLAKKGAISGGNIGTPLAELDPNAPIWILESSSFALHHTKYASPDIYLLLPVTSDHLDWHETPEQYEADKLRPLLGMREGELALVPKGLSLPDTDAWVVEYNDDAFLEHFFDLDSSKLKYRAAFLQDALLSLAISRTLFDETDYSLLNDFQLDNHRQEEIDDHLGRLWVNDSKATNADASMQAIKAYSHNKIHLILGGDDKGLDLSILMDFIASQTIELYAVGSNSDKLASMASKRNITHHNCKQIDIAVRKINQNLTQNHVALLSPAASSLDQFSSYAKRGEFFINEIKKLSDS
ncbi:MAG: UDP-N-acetylmuramoyl-L-alanine--D-glutamate ligase [Sulfurovum sp.]|nr:UDP-N-acetylmuramoyl-L-alanine--D-glutamate ligase [Sulfurovum sp.]